MYYVTTSLISNKKYYYYLHDSYMHKYILYRNQCIKVVCVKYYNINERYKQITFNELPIKFQCYINKINSILYKELIK